ncbi:MAG: hypothetical protein JXC31_04060, partial [Acholeplasmataceae bacterium]|nr:hypothetical protein [Acholeplasmataceae bacterium]
MIDFLKMNTNMIKMIKKTSKKVFFKSSTDTYNAYLAALDYIENKQTIFIVLPNLYEAQKYYDQMSQIVDADDVLFYPADQTLTNIMALGSPEFKSERLYTLKQLMSGKPFIVVTTLQGLCQRQLAQEDYINSVKTLQRNESYDLHYLVQYLVYSGYSKTYTVEKPGEFSLRGHILDLFTLNHDQPYRLDFFDDILDQIKIFDVETQRSFAEIESIEVAPMNELFYTDQMKSDAISEIKRFFKDRNLSEREQEKLNQDLESIEMRVKLDGLGIYIPFFNHDETTVIDYSQDKKIYMIDVHKMKINEQSILDDLNTYAVTMNGSNFLSIPFRISLERQLSLNHIEIDNFGLNSPEDAIDLGVSATNNYQGNLQLLALDIKDIVRTYRVIFCLSTKLYYDEIQKFFNDKKMVYKTQLDDASGIYLLNQSSYGSFLSKEDKILLLDEAQLFSYKVRPAIRYRSVLNQATKIRRVEDLVTGDFVVHYDYGIGRYVGLKTMELSQEKRDYLHIIYANEEALYVPMDQIDMVLKYSSHDGMHPKLSKLGGKQWTKTKASVRMKIKDLSDRLVALYAQRQQSVGFSYAKDNEMQIAFERDFSYETTRDQQKAIIDTKF